MGLGGESALCGSGRNSPVDKSIGYFLLGTLLALIGLVVVV
jgi:hypothetical protein